MTDLTGVASLLTAATGAGLGAAAILLQRRGQGLEHKQDRAAARVEAERVELEQFRALVAAMKQRAEAAEKREDRARERYDEVDGRLNTALASVERERERTEALRDASDADRERYRSAISELLDAFAALRAVVLDEVARTAAADLDDRMRDVFDLPQPVPKRLEDEANQLGPATPGGEATPHGP